MREQEREGAVGKFPLCLVWQQAQGGCSSAEVSAAPWQCLLAAPLAAAWHCRLRLLSCAQPSLAALQHKASSALQTSLEATQGFPMLDLVFSGMNMAAIPKSANRISAKTLIIITYYCTSRPVPSSSGPLPYSFCWKNCHFVSPSAPVTAIQTDCALHLSSAFSALCCPYTNADMGNVWVWFSISIMQRPTSSLVGSHLCCWAESFLPDSCVVAKSQQLQLHQWAAVLIDTDLAVQKGKIDVRNKDVSFS